MSRYVSPQRKQECIDYASANPEISTANLASDFGVGHSTLCKWLKKAREHGVACASRTLSAEQQRIKDLEKENAHLREVNEIIKKRTCTLSTIQVDNPSRQSKSTIQVDEVHGLLAKSS